MVNLMNLPETFSRITGEEGDAHKLMSDFFINSKEYIECKVNREIPLYFEIESGFLAYGSERVNSNDRLTFLKLEDKYVVAGMIETRTPYNYVQFTFFRDLSFLENIISQ